MDKENTLNISYRVNLNSEYSNKTERMTIEKNSMQFEKARK